MEKRSEEERAKTHLRGVILGILVGLFFALQYLCMAAQNKIYLAPFESNFTRLFCYCGLVWIFVLVTRNHYPRWKSPEEKEELRAYSLMGLIGCLSLGIGDSIYQIGVVDNGTALSITIASNSPLINQLFARVFLKEKFRTYFLFGVICIIIGNILVVF